MISRLALVALALSVTVPVCSSSILQAPLGARLDSGDSSLFTRAWSAVSSGLPRITNTRVLLADAAVTYMTSIIRLMECNFWNCHKALKMR